VEGFSLFLAYIFGLGLLAVTVIKVEGWFRKQRAIEARLDAVVEVLYRLKQDVDDLR
jgi:hypothetical protein